MKEWFYELQNEKICSRYRVICNGFAVFISLVLASVLIAYLMYRIDSLVPCMSIVILSAILCKKVLTV